MQTSRLVGAPMEEEIFKVASWGKYVYRAEVERQNFDLCIQNDDSGVRYLIYSSQWLASLFVVVEGWQNLRLQDPRIDKILSAYEDYVLTIKRCRNAVYHYQEDIVDKRVEKAVSNGDLLIWAGALLDEYIRFLYMYPISAHGLCEESLCLQIEYMDLIGWRPENENLVKWLGVVVDVFRYFEGGCADLLERNPENDKKVGAALKAALEAEVNPYFSLLSRLQASDV